MPQLGQAVCAGRFSLQRAQVTRVGALAFHCERRLRVLDRDILRLGTGTVHPLLGCAQSLMDTCSSKDCPLSLRRLLARPLIGFGQQRLKRRPPRIPRRVFMGRIQRFDPLAALGANPPAIR